MTEFKITVIKKLTKLQECSESSMNSGIKLMRKRNTSSKRLKLLKKKQAEILDMNNIIKKIKKNLESLKNRADIMDERISDLEDRKIEILPVDEEREL